jgi:uncharacterized protein (TIGR02266 family)
MSHESPLPDRKSQADAEGERALSELAPALAAVDGVRVARPSADPHAAAATALLVADYLGQPELRAKLDDVSMAPESVAQLRRLARALITAVTRLGGEYLPDAQGIPGDLVQRGQHVRTTISAAIEKALPHDAEVQMWLEAIRLGSGVVDLVYDLRSLGELCTMHGAESGAPPGAAASALAAADAIEFALRTGDSAENTATRTTVARLWTLFLPAYERAAAAGRALTRNQGKERQFPPLALVASHRRARRKPVSLVPPAHPGHPGAPHHRRSRPPPAMPKPGSLPKTAVAKPAMPNLEVELIDAEALEIEVGLSEPPPAKLPSTPPTAGERQSWSDTRRANRQTVEIEVGISSESNFYLGFTENLSAGGVFVATYALKPLGSQLEVALAFPSGDEMRVPGIVRWLREATPDGWPGMGVQFESLSPADEAKIRKFLSLRDPLFYDD